MAFSGALLRYALLLLAFLPFVYYVLAAVSSRKFFRGHADDAAVAFSPPISVLKPVRGMDLDAYENFASFCMQDYPCYEIVFCIDGPQDPVYPLLEKLAKHFPNSQIRVLFAARGISANDKVAKLTCLTAAARYEHLIISDSDVRVRPDYLRTLIKPLADAATGGATCFYLQSRDTSFTETLQTIGMVSDFYAGILTDWNLTGVRFTLGPTIATTRARLEEFGGYKSIENRPGDDLLVGQSIAQQGHKVELLDYCVEVVADYGSLRDLLRKRLRWMVEMRHLRSRGHAGLLFTQGLLGLGLATILVPTARMVIAYFLSYLALRFIMTWSIASGLGRENLVRNFWMVPVWDAIALGIWVSSFASRGCRWRGNEYRVRDGILIPVSPSRHSAISPAARANPSKQEGETKER